MGYSKYLEVVKIELVDRTSYLWNMVAWGGIICIILFVFMNIWQTIYAGKPALEGFTMPQMIWYLAFAEVIVFSTSANHIEKIGEQVQQGIIVNTLTKPINYVGKEMAVLFAHFVYSFCICGIIAFVMAYLLMGPIVVSVLDLPLVAVVLIGGVILNFLFVMSLGLLAFWFEDVSSLFFIYQKAIFILGGMLVPIDVYPVWLQGILKFLPFSFVTYLPAKLFVHFNINDFVTAIMGQAAWIIVLLVITIIIYKRGIRQVSVHGG